MNTRKQLGASEEVHTFVTSQAKALNLRYTKTLVDYVFNKIRKDKAFVAQMKADLKK